MKQFLVKTLSYLLAVVLLILITLAIYRYLSVPRELSILPAIHTAEASPLPIPAQKLPVATSSPLSPADSIFAEIPLLKRACSCESWGDPNKNPREFNSQGGVLTGVPNPNDKGACQINVPTWGAKAKQLGFDIYTLIGNVEMAHYIYTTQGMAAWRYSESCWQVKP